MTERTHTHTHTHTLTHTHTHTHVSPRGSGGQGSFLACLVQYCISVVHGVTKEFDANLVTKQQTKDSHVLILGTPEYATSCH